MVEQPPFYIAVLTGERLSLVEFFFFVSYFKNAFVQFSQVFNEKVLLCIRESATPNERSN